MAGENNNVCKEHSGCLADINHLKEQDREIWTEMGKHEERINTILTRINVILGMLLVSIIGLGLNLALR